MNSYTYPEPLFRTFPARRIPVVSRQAAPTESRSMFKVVGWGLTIVAVGFLTWQLISSTPMLPSVVSAVLLVFVSVVAGMRVGVQGATAYIHDVHRLNKVLADQQHELEELNANLLQQLSESAEQRKTEQKLS